MTSCNHKLVVKENKSEPKQVSKGKKTSCVDLSSMHEEADIFLTQQAIHIAKEDAKSRVSVVSDVTDVFALLLYFYWNEKLQSTMTMQSPIKGRSCIDIKETSRIHSDTVGSVLAIHALTGCNSVAATYGIGKTKAIKVRVHTLDQLGQSKADLTDVVKQSFHGCMLWLQSTMLFHDGMLPAAVGTENRKYNSSTETVWFATNN